MSFEFRLNLILSIIINCIPLSAYHIFIIKLSMVEIKANYKHYLNLLKNLLGIYNSLRNSIVKVMLGIL